MIPGAEEFRQRFAGRYFGKYRGVVTDVSGDDLKLLRIKVRVPVVAGTEDLGWAWPADRGGGVRTGMAWPPQRGDNVWVEFEEGDPQRPVWSPGAWGRRDSEAMLPKHARGERDDIDSLIRNTGIIPDSTFAGEYPNVRVMQSPSGHLFEFDDTSDEERVQLAHKEGTRVEMLADGSMEVVSKDEMRQYSGKGYMFECLEAASFESHQDMTLKSAAGEIILGTGSPGVQLGGTSATQPYVLGTDWQTLMTNVLTTLSTHTHASFGAPPTEAVAIAAFIGQLSTVLSSYIKGR